MNAAIRIDPETGQKLFNTKAAKASEKIAGKGYSILADQALKALPELPAGATFNAEEQGLEHQIAMPKVPPPEELPGEAELLAAGLDQAPEGMRRYWQRPRPLEMRPADVRHFLSRDALDPVQRVWIRTTGRLPDDPEIHRCVLAYASDMTLLDTALFAHGRILFDPDLQVASLDHALWFHRPFRADEWLLYAQDSPSGSGGRGFTRGSLFTREGALVASVAQEGLIRVRRR